MPVKTAALSADLGLPAEAVAAKVRDALEGALAQSPSMIAVNRSDLADVVSEQRIAASGLANAELAPAARRLIPAQFLVYATADRVDVSTRTEKKSNSTAESYHRQALEKEKQAASVASEAQAATAELDRKRRYEDRGAIDTLGRGLMALTNCDSYYDMCRTNNSPSCQAMAAGMARNCASQKQLNQDNLDRRYQSELQSMEREASELQADASRLQREAQFLRRQADLEAQKTVAETRKTTAQVVVNWKAVDTSTGAVVGSGSASGSDTIEDTGEAVQSAFRSSETAASTRYETVINRALATVAPRLREDIESRLATQPVRVKVARVSASGVIINAGKDLGVGVGDTFGVRQKSEVLTDPDTGLSLDNQGPPIGVIRVSEVLDKSAVAQIIEKAGQLRRGDELEWIGVFGVASR
jgi:hypothetical protein